MCVVVTTGGQCSALRGHSCLRSASKKLAIEPLHFELVCNNILQHSVNCWILIVIFDKIYPRNKLMFFLFSNFGELFALNQSLQVLLYVITR